MSERNGEQAHADRATTVGRMLDWTEAGLWIVLLVVGSFVALAVLRDSETRNRPRAAAKPAPGGLTEAEKKRELQDCDPEYGWRECEIENCTNAVRFGPRNTVTYCPGCGRAYKRVGNWGVAIGWFVHDDQLDLDDRKYPRDRNKRKAR